MALAESFNSKDDRSSWERDLAQKQVTIMTSWLAVPQVAKADERV
jgi:hypothetical protein